MNKIITLLFLCFVFSVSSQTKKTEFTLKGTITYFNSPAANVSVAVEEVNRRAYSDENGKFEINVKIGEVVLFTRKDLKDYYFTIDNSRNTVINLEMQPNVEELNEVILSSKKINQNKKDEDLLETAYGKMRVSQFNTISEEDINEAAIDLLSVIRGKIPGVKVIGTSVLIRQKPVLFDVDGVVTSRVPIDLNVNNIDKIVVLKGLSQTFMYTEAEGGGVIVINTKTANRSRTEPGTNKPYDQARLRNNNYDNKAINNNEIRSLKPDYINEINSASKLEEAISVYQNYKNIYGSSPYYYLDVAKEIYSKFNDSASFIDITSNISKQFSTEIPALKALAYSYDEMEFYNESVKLYERIVKLKPSYRQSYRDLAMAYKMINDKNKAVRMYSRIINLGKDSLTSDFDILKKNELESLIISLDNEVSKDAIQITEELDSDVRIVFEWNNANTEFELQLVNPDMQYYRWKHTWDSDNDKVLSDELKIGYAIKEFYIDELSYTDKWLMNIKYFGNKSFDPTYLKVTTTFDFGKSTERSKIKIFKLTVKDINQQLLDVSRISFN